MTESSRGYRPVVRRARTSDVPAIKQLVDTYAGRILL
ncbi:MAG: N-acetylglutamate synthase, partial [Chloroflexi bacterium]|nr:N-acetylglutamate synthase [Chloroflexota bacterium]